ncbi:MAG: hypothetical protein E7813_00580 [Bradyrhizobium sp.]|uniref:hypothetical protein n=1 Tax=Bradyrhizobium sp. TaxID=376 RepID=UPI001205A06B|nr:hypothetical protein [Bradyrhizobium sp.]THD75417.1 MAG: hypothetical protein E7813_00580 [Bradyrhizobium sp.]
MSKQDNSAPPAPPGQPPDGNPDGDSRPIPDSVLAIFLVVLVAALLLGYLFLNKMVDISRQEDCMLAHRTNCQASELPPDR